MKNIKLLFLSLILLGLAVPSYAASYGVGDEPHLIEATGAPTSYPTNVYTLVRYPENRDSSPSLSTGDVVIWDDVSDDGVTVNLVDKTGVTTSTDHVAGVVVDTIPTAETTGTTTVTDIGRRNWGYIQTYGLHTAVRVSAAVGAQATAISAGDPLHACGFPGVACTIGTGTGRDGFGFALDASTSAGEAIEVFIRAR